MSYNPEDYQVTDVNSYEDGGMSFYVTIKGADFIIFRYLNDYKPTNTFKFNYNIRPAVDEKRNITGTVKIDEDTCLSGMHHIAEQMSELSGINFKVIPGINSNGLTQFVEVGDA